MRSHKKGFTLIELLVVISIIALLIGILLPALGAARKTARQMKSSTQVRGVIQGMVMYANSNNHYYPGLDGSGKNATADATKPYKADDPTTAATQNPYAYAVLLNGNFFTPEYIISPGETVGAITSNTGSSGTPVTVKVGSSTALSDTETSYSYSLLSYWDATNDAGRRAEWRDTINSSAVIMTDRHKGKGDLGTASVWVSANEATFDPANWRGSIGWNDDHVEFGTTAQMATTTYGTTANTDDKLFDDTDDTATGTPTGSNAFMVYGD